MKIKKNLSLLWAKLNRAKIAFFCLWGISIFFIFSSMLADLLGKYLKVYPSYTGGEIAGEYIDTSDIARYIVHQPVTNARWQKSPEYWQLDLELKEKSSVIPDINLYLDFGNLEGGSVAFGHQWDFLVKLSDDGGKVYDADGEYICDTEMYFLKDQITIKTRIPLQDKKLQKVLGAKKTYHYVASDELKGPENWLEASMEDSTIFALQEAEKMIE